MRVGVLHGGLELEADKEKATPPSQKLYVVQKYATPKPRPSKPRHHYAATPVLSPTTSPLDSPVSSARSSPPPQTPGESPVFSSATLKGDGTEDVSVFGLEASP